MLVCIAHDPGLRLRDIAEQVGITEREGRYRYRVQTHVSLPDAGVPKASVGEVLAVLVDGSASS